MLRRRWEFEPGRCRVCPDIQPIQRLSGLEPPGRIVHMLLEIAQLYTAFDKVFPRPESYWGEGCCVQPEHEEVLLRLPREQWTEEMLSMPGSHIGICFATFEQASYLIPRLLELLAEAENGFSYGTLNMNVPRFLREHESDYATLRLWQLIENTFIAIFRERTSEFAIRSEYPDYVAGTDGIDDFLGEFYLPLLSGRHCPDGSSGWDEFFRLWAEDDSPARIAHLLGVTKRHFDDDLFEWAPPESYLERVRDVGYTELLLARAEPAMKSVESPTWLNDLRAALRSAL